MGPATDFPKIALEAVPETPAIDAEGLVVSRILGHEQGANHLAAATSRLGAGGTIPGHEHPFEESFFVLEGRVVVTISRWRTGQDSNLEPSDP